MRALMLALSGCLLASPIAACDTALLLAVDVSGSISGDEYIMQMQGLADAMLDPAVMEALILGQDKVALLHWSGLRNQRLSLPWQSLRTRQDVEAFAAAIRKVKRPQDHTDTAIGAALYVALTLFPVPDCRRSVIDLSGDGTENAGTSLSAARAAVAAQGITINGIAIEEAHRLALLSEYFRQSVITPDGFVVTARSITDYPRAIRVKLLRELIKSVS
jgi:Ca-activated chloride channel homolog